MTTRRAQCSCGQLAAVCEGEPVRVSVCLDFPAPFLSFYHQSRRTPWVGIGAEPLERID